MVGDLSDYPARAVTPDQLLPYVKAVSQMESRKCGEGILHTLDDFGVLVVYPADNPENDAAVDDACELALADQSIRKLTVIAASAPACAPENAQIKMDIYWQLPVPHTKPRGKLANMLARASREIEISQSVGADCWTDAHNDMAREFCQRKNIDEDSAFLFSQMGKYLGNAPEAILFSAYAKAGHELVACAIGDYSAFATAFYMFAFRKPDAPPGSADALLAAIIDEAASRGHSRLNLGLGIDPGVEFFKKKWQAEPFLKYTETSWEIPQKKSFFARLFGG